MFLLTCNTVISLHSNRTIRYNIAYINNVTCVLYIYAAYIEDRAQFLHNISSTGL